MKPGDEFIEFPIRSNKLSMRVKVRQWLHHEESPFQTIDIVDTDVFGRVLFLDGHVQLSEFDEPAYHEALVHLPLLSIEKPSRALVIGGGDGGVLRELVKHSSLSVIEMVEIDQKVVESSRAYLPDVSDNAFDDPRVTLHIADAFDFVKRASEPYDLIIMDVTDTYEDEEGEISEQLFTDAFHTDCKNALKSTGFLVSQADNPVFCRYSLDGVLETFAKQFRNVGWYQSLVPSFGGFSAFAWAADSNAIDFDVIATRLGSLHLKYLNDVTLSIAKQSIAFS